MSFSPRPSALRSLGLLLSLLPACYASQVDGGEQAMTQAKAASVEAGRAALPAAASGQASAPVSADAGLNRELTSHSAAAQTGAGGCGAIRDPNAAVTADTSAFTGVGGAGFDLVGVCDRCGWSHQADNCRSLVYSVPTIDGADYNPCWQESFDWVDCVEKMSCICDGTVPAACQAIKDHLDACRH